MRILVLDGNENQAVACVRSLSDAGHTVSVGAATAWSKAGWSRGCCGSFVYPAPQQDAEAFVARIVQEASLEPGTLVLPVTERSTLPLSAQRDLLSAAGARIVLPSHKSVLRAFDKQETVRLAESLGIAVPKTVFIGCREQARRAAETLTYPVVMKPGNSEEFSAGKVRANGAPLYALDPNEFNAAYEDMCRRSEAGRQDACAPRCAPRSVLAQEYVEGEGAGFFALLHQGDVRAEFAHRRIRDVRPTGSGSAVRVSTRAGSRMRDAALAILEALGWHGVAMVEFRIRADGEPVFMEVNGRFWTSLALAVYAGADFPARLAEMAERGDVERTDAYRTGVRCRWLLGDFRHLIEVWRGAPAGFPGTYPGRLRTIMQFLTPVAGTHHDNFRLTDPMPELGDWIDFFFRRVPARLRKATEAREKLNVERRYSHS
jgi:predicted ATP-grasp superfamily ATP-dependent carboligase